METTETNQRPEKSLGIVKLILRAFRFPIRHPLITIVIALLCVFSSVSFLAHFNPAITLAFAFQADFPKRRIPGYFVAQLLGAFIAASAVFFLFESQISALEESKHITRGEPESIATARIFGEYFAKPVSHITAICAEFLGTLLLALVIFGFTAKQNKSGPGPMTPIAIGMALTTLICVFAPLTQAGFNPARDLAPRFFSAIAGWGTVPFSHNGMGWLTVYVLAPCGGALTGAWIGNFLFSRE